MCALALFVQCKNSIHPIHIILAEPQRRNLMFHHFNFGLCLFCVLFAYILHISRVLFCLQIFGWNYDMKAYIFYPQIFLLHKMMAQYLAQCRFFWFRIAEPTTEMIFHFIFIENFFCVFSAWKMLLYFKLCSTDHMPCEWNALQIFIDESEELGDP